MRVLYLPLFALLGVACHAGAPPPTALPEPPVAVPPAPVLAPRLARCAPGVDPAVAARGVAWVGSPTTAARQAIAEQFVANSGIPWDRVQVSALGRVDHAVLNDQNAALAGDTSWGVWSLFWQTFLRNQDPAIASLAFGSPDDTAEPVPRPVRDITFTQGTGSVYINWAGTYEPDSVHYRARLWGEPGGGWPAVDSQLGDDALTCIADLSLPTPVHADYTIRACPHCDDQAAELDFVVEDLHWVRSAVIVADRSGHVSLRWMASARPRNTPAELIPLTSPHALTWEDARVGSVRLDANTGEDLSELVCRPYQRLRSQLICGPDAARVEWLEQLLQTPTIWTRG